MIFITSAGSLAAVSTFMVKMFWFIAPNNNVKFHINLYSSRAVGKITVPSATPVAISLYIVGSVDVWYCSNNDTQGRFGPAATILRSFNSSAFHENSSFYPIVIKADNPRIKSGYIFLGALLLTLDTFLLTLL